MKTSEFFK